MIVTKDSDFSDLSVILGYPPKILWIRRGNCTTAEIEAILRANFEAVEALVGDENAGILTLF